MALGESWSETRDSDRDFMDAVVDALVPMITEALAAHFYAQAERLDARVKKSGYALGVEVERERDHALNAARYIQRWQPE